MNTRSRARAIGLTAAAALAASAVAAASGSTATAAELLVVSDETTYTFVVGEVTDPGTRLVLDVGHTDAVAPVFENGELTLMTKDDTNLHAPGVVYRDPADLIFQVLPSAEVAVPGIPAYAFLGEAGDPVWMLPMTQDPSLLWPGWSTEHSSLHSEFTSIRYEITDVAGPGDFHLFLNDAFGGPIHRANSVGTLSNTWTEQVPAHVHSNWAFTEPGTYEITFQVSGTWLNAPEPDPDPTTTLSISGVADLYQPGDTASLTAVQDPPTGLDSYQWFLHSGEGDDYPIDGATTDTYEFTPLASDDGIQMLVRLYDAEGDLIAESAPATIHVDSEPDPAPTLSISGLADHYHSGDMVTLTAVQDPPTSEDHYHWFVQAPGATEFVVVNGALSDTYAFEATAALDGAQVLARLYDHDHAVIAESAPVTVEVDDHEEPEPELSQTITATLEADEGALVVSVDPNDREVVMGAFALATGGDHWESTGELRPVQITDTRPGQPGWNVAGHVGDFSSGDSTVGAEHLGWTPEIVAQSEGQGAVAGAPVAPGTTPGEGLSTGRGLASAPAGSGRGTATAAGELELQLPTTAEAGTYTALLTLTTI